MLTDNRIQREHPVGLPERVFYKLRKMCSRKGREIRNRKIREVLSDIPFSILCNNCLGGVFYHDAGRQFTTPTVNLAMDGEDFIRFVENPKYYLSQPMNFIETDLVSYPVAHIDDIEVRFVHYHTAEECAAVWRRRAERIDWNNLYIIATDHDGLNRQDLLERFDSLPYKNKVMFTAHEYPQYSWAICVPQFKGRFQVKVMTLFADFKGTRYYETCFDIAQWIAKKYKDK